MKMSINMSQHDQKIFNKYFKQPAIWYQPAFGIIFGINAGIMLSQLLYWNGKGANKEWTFKTIPDMEYETGLSLTEQRTAIRELIKHGVIDVKRKGVPQKRHFKVNVERLHEILPSLKVMNKLTYPNPPNYKVRNDQTITKTTQETTAKNTVRVSDLHELNRQKAKLVRRMTTYKKH